jgi:hypothetical protein
VGFVFDEVFLFSLLGSIFLLVDIDFINSDTDKTSSKNVFTHGKKVGPGVSGRLLVGSCEVIVAYIMVNKIITTAAIMFFRRIRISLN